MGEPILELGKGWYNTHQFSLEPIFHNRILKHPCRVEKEEEAKLFYVPFYGALDMLRTHFSNNVSEKSVDVLSKEVVEWLQRQRMWKRNLGLDHVFVLGKNSWDLRRSENLPWGTPLLELNELQNPIKLIIERQPWHMNDVGVPYPTYFHPSSDKEIIAWQEKIRHRRRKYLISFAGARRDEDSSSIRSILIEQCTSIIDTRVCKFLNCANQSCVETAPVVELFVESEFCLQPDGDSPTRKSLFDSLVAGCIPVVFDPFTAHYQYPWHLPEDHTKYSVFIDQEEVRMSEVNVVEKLVKIPFKQRQEMRKYIIDELMPRLVYAHVDSKLEKFDDAFTIAVNSVLEMVVSRLTR
ncbi:Xyloglucan-specific galacturonosyltransferase 1 [Bienertia sinuspersici]